MKPVSHLAARRVLVVEDDHIIREVVGEALADEGYEVRLATNGREALTVLDGWRPDLILLDLMMPEVDGWSFRAEQRRRGMATDVPLVLMSAARDLNGNATRLGASGSIAKPFDLDDLVGLVAQLTEE